MTDKKKFTIKEHVEMGKILKDCTDALIQNSTKVSNAYPHSLKVLRHFDKAIDELNKIRSKLENAMCKDSAISSDEWPIRFTRVYYGANQRRLLPHEIELLVDCKPLKADRTPKNKS